MSGCERLLPPLAIADTAVRGRRADGRKWPSFLLGRLTVAGGPRGPCFGLATFVLLLILPAFARARYGSWQCTSDRKIVSRGDFRSYHFAPVLSPRVRAFRWSTTLHYLNNLTCLYQLRAPFDHHIYYELPAFDLHHDCRGDRVLISGGDRTRRMLCGSRSRLLHPYGVIRSNVVTMKFSTDAVATATGFSGFFAAFKPQGSLVPASVKAGLPPSRTRRGEPGDDDDQYSMPKTTIGEINLQQMRVLTGEASLDSYCRSMKRFGWELTTSSCAVRSDPWSTPPRLQSLAHSYRQPGQPPADTPDPEDVRPLARRSVRDVVVHAGDAFGSPTERPAVGGEPFGGERPRLDVEPVAARLRRKLNRTGDQRRPWTSALGGDTAGDDT